VRHFLACCSEDAIGARTVASIEIAGETFTARGLAIRERDFLDVYPLEKWNDNSIPGPFDSSRSLSLLFTHFSSISYSLCSFSIQPDVYPTSILLTEGKTAAPKLLTVSWRCLSAVSLSGSYLSFLFSPGRKPS
jgi:hypothetical protein